MLVARPGLPAANVKELIDYAKKNPGKLNYGSVGAGGVNHLAFAWFNTLNGLEMQHVPYKGLVQGLQDVMTDRLDAMFAVIGGAAPYLKAGKMKGLAVSGQSRNALIPDVPTFAEAGLPNFDASFYFSPRSRARSSPAPSSRRNSCRTSASRRYATRRRTSRPSW
jgi:tripartite-type tricarboxylate transporter receptor subunit TctC